MSAFAISAHESAPRITEMRVIPVAGHDSMLLNLSGAHGPYFTRNLVLLTDSSARMGAGEVPGGEKIRRVLEGSRELVVGRSIAAYEEVLREVETRFAGEDSEGEFEHGALVMGVTRMVRGNGRIVTSVTCS